MQYSIRSLLLAILLTVAYRSDAQQLSFHEHIAPIIHANCTPCHRPGEAGPFSLISYEDVSKRGSFIKKVIETGFMPPWRPDNSFVHFANDRSLSNDEKKKILDWIDAQMPEGKKPSAKQVEPGLKGTAYYRKPDLVLQQAAVYQIPGDNLERFLVYKIPFDLPDSANVEGIEFFSNNKKLIHHANFAIHPVDKSIDINAASPQLNLTEQDRTLYDQYLPFKKLMTYYGGWIPGTSYETYPEGMGWVMPRRGVILLTVHYGPNAKPEETLSGINFFFTKKPIARTVKVISFGSGGVGEQDIQPRFTFIPPNKISKFTLKVQNRMEDQSVLYLWPHMHLLGKTFTSYAVTPAGDTISLVRIPEWDFRWQEIYRVQNLIKIPKGAIIHIEGDYDNTSNNPFNPNSPPQGIFSWGDMKTNEEMLTMVMVFLPYQPGDEKKGLIIKK